MIFQQLLDKNIFIMNTVNIKIIIAKEKNIRVPIKSSFSVSVPTVKIQKPLRKFIDKPEIAVEIQNIELNFTGTNEANEFNEDHNIQLHVPSKKHIIKVKI